MTDLTIEVLIPSFNGRDLLAKHLPEVIANSQGKARITVVDDGSTDDTSTFLSKEFPEINLIANEKNLGFTKSVNLGFKEIKSDLVVLLNNDVSPAKNYLESALKYFDNDQVFAVTLNETTSSWPKVRFSGKLQYTRGEDKESPRYSAWASGGSAIFRRSLWEKLGGFDEVYSPGYWEDIDIGWRAWKAGYFIIWDPDAKVEHQHESTFSVLDKNFVSLLKQKNELIFNWKNITDPDLRRQHLVYLIKHTLSHPGYAKVVASGLLAFPKAKKTHPSVRSDKAILDLVNQPVP
jgi:GT2 family glycosyltransferase